jgi:CHASE2 domain-containing sensor protein
MTKLVVLKFGEGSFERGFPVTLQIGFERERPETEIGGKLPAAPEILKLYNNWRSLYLSLGGNYRLEALASQVTNVALHEIHQDCCDAAQLLRDSLNDWLRAESFRSLREKWLEKLKPSDEVRVLLQAEDLQLQRLPWHLWDLLDRYPKAEIASIAPAYEGVINSSRIKSKVKILAILGNSVGIDTQADRAMLEQLPNAQIRFLVEPQHQELTERLWEQNWDILFFAGHSSSQGDEQKGRIYLNQTDSLAIAQLKYALKKAVAGGLKIAIFNSCDGLGLARELADLQIGQIIFMREPVPDRVAQEFLKYFLAAFATGKSFYLAVREAREKLEGLETQFPCATWLPVIWQNPAQMPPTWQELCGGRGSVSFGKSRQTRFQAVLLTSIASASLLLGVRWMGMLQPMELWAFDRLLRLRPEEEADPRLLVVTVTDADIQAQSQEPRQGSLSDAALEPLLEKLERYQPRAIGLDIYRESPVAANYQNLAVRLRQDRYLIATCKGRDPERDPTGVKPPPEVPEARLGFSDFLEDADGILRRQLLVMNPDPVSACSTPYALSVQLAFRYLEKEGILPTFTPEKNLQLGSTIFKRMTSRTGGYQPIDARGSQVLLNYRSLSSPDKIAPQVTLTEVLSDRLNPQAVKDRVILIGVTANSAGDYWATPYDAGSADKISGVFLQAQMVSQILSAVLDRRPLLQVWTQWGESIWIWCWSLVGSLLACRFRQLTHLVLASGTAILILSGLCFVFLLGGWWVPFIPSGLALMAAVGWIAFKPVKSQKQK